MSKGDYSHIASQNFNLNTDVYNSNHTDLTVTICKNVFPLRVTQGSRTKVQIRSNELSMLKSSINKSQASISKSGEAKKV